MIKSAVLAAVAVMGIGSAAGAATVKNYDLHLRYEGTTHYEFSYYTLPADGSSPIYSLDSYDKKNEFGLDVKSNAFGYLNVGNIIRFVAQIVFPDDESNIIGQYDNGGRAPVCMVGQVSCTNTSESYRVNADGFRINYSDLTAIKTDSNIGSAFTYSAWYIGSSSTTEDGLFGYYSRDQESHFTVVSAPSPVPLPASAALLPLGLGALAFMRKRRRKTS